MSKLWPIVVSDRRLQLCRPSSLSATLEKYRVTCDPWSPLPPALHRPIGCKSFRSWRREIFCFPAVIDKRLLSAAFWAQTVFFEPSKTSAGRLGGASGAHHPVGILSIYSLKVHSELWAKFSPAVNPVNDIVESKSGRVQRASAGSHFWAYRAFK